MASSAKDTGVLGETVHCSSGAVYGQPGPGRLVTSESKEVIKDSWSHAKRQRKLLRGATGKRGTVLASRIQ